MNCREFVDFLMRYLDGDLDPEATRVFEEHMFLCPPCLTFLDTYKDTIRLGRFACEESGGPSREDVPEELIQAILAVRRRGS